MKTLIYILLNLSIIMVSDLMSLDKNNPMKVQSENSLGDISEVPQYRIRGSGSFYDGFLNRTVWKEEMSSDPRLLILKKNYLKRLICEGVGIIDMRGVGSEFTNKLGFRLIGDFTNVQDGLDSVSESINEQLAGYNVVMIYTAEFHCAYHYNRIPTEIKEYKILPGDVVLVGY